MHAAHRQSLKKIYLLRKAFPALHNIDMMIKVFSKLQLRVYSCIKAATAILEKSWTLISS